MRIHAFTYGLCTLAAGIAVVPTSQAEEVPRSDSPAKPAIDLEVAEGPKVKFDALIGTSLTSAPEYSGSNRREASLRPLGALRYGRLRLATSGTGSLLDFGAESDASGVSLDVLQASRLKLRTGLRLSSGRDSADSDDLAGIPDVRKTLLGRAAATYALTPAWSLGSTLNADLLGRGTGVFITSGADWRHPLAVDTELHVGAGFTVANSTHMNSYFGVPLSASTERRPAYSAGAGLKDAGVGLGLTKAIGPNWMAFGGLSYTRLLGDAADSPLTHERSSISATLGVAWRCCR